MIFLYVSLALSSINIFDSAPPSQINLYSILGVKKNAQQKELLKAYKRFQVKKKRMENNYDLNETRNSNLQPNEKILKQWKQIEYSYSILSDSTSRELYDTYGFKLINQTSFSVFGYQSDFQALFMKDLFNQDINPFGGIIVYPLHFTLLDAMNGCKKTIKVIQTVPCHCPRGGTKCSKCRNNKFMGQAVQYTVEVPPGAPNDFRILVKDLGDSPSARGASDIIFVCKFVSDENQDLTDSEVDNIFQRLDPYGSDLLVSKRITLSQIIEGSQIEIENLNGEKLMVPISDGEKLTLTYNLEKKIVGKGLPVFDEPKKRGDLYVKFLVDFPESLTEEQKKIIAKILPTGTDQYQ